MSEPLYRKPQGVQTRWASPENFTAAKGAAAQSFEGRKGSAHFPLPAGASQPLDFDQMIATQGCSVYERQDDWCSCAYFYLDQPENHLPPLAPPAERIAGLVSAADATKHTDLQP